MASVNRVTLVGNLGRDPESRTLPGGEAVATFSLATTEQWKDKSGNKQERTDWHRVEFFGRPAEICNQYLKKGSPVYIEGRIQYDKWTDKDGVDKTITKIRGERMQMLGSKGEAAAGAVGPAPSEPLSVDGAPPAMGRPVKEKKLDDFDDDIPF